MKKIRRLFAIILSLLLVFTVPITALAVVPPEDSYNLEILDQDEVLQLMISAFPEYEDKILGQYSNQSNISFLSVEESEVVVYETRIISDDMSVTYQENSSGLSYTFLTHGKSYTESTSNSDGTIYTYDVNIYVYNKLFTTINDAKQMNIIGFRYKKVINGYDYITNRGSLSNYGLAANPTYGTYQSAENASSLAYSNYHASFLVDVPVGVGVLTYNVTAVVTVVVGNDSLAVGVDENSGLMN